MAITLSLKNESGFTLLELIVVMGIFIVVIMISAGTFEKIIKMSSQQVKSSESNIQGVVGLELMRADLEHAGYGLPWTLSFVANFEESSVEANTLANGIDPALFNDNNNASGDENKVPRAVQSATATGAGDWENGRDYLVIKSANVGMSSVARNWSYVVGVDTSSSIKEWGYEDFVQNDWVITLNSKDRRLIGSDMTHFSYQIPAKSGGVFKVPTDYQPMDDSEVYLVYGLRNNNPATTLRAPYNRVDFYIKRPASVNDMPTRCAQGSGILYKAVLKHEDGEVSSYPLLDCVADMQVIYSLDTNEDGGVDLHANEDALSVMSSSDIRKQLKEIRVYILSHEGEKDASFMYPNSTIPMGEYGLGRSYDLTKLSGIGTDWKFYRWKIYTLVVVPRNL